MPISPERPPRSRSSVQNGKVTCGRDIGSITVKMSEEIAHSRSNATIASQLRTSNAGTNEENSHHRCKEHCGNNTLERTCQLHTCSTHVRHMFDTCSTAFFHMICLAAATPGQVL